MSHRANDIALLLLRLVFGGLMIANHGWPKLLRLTGEEPIKFADPLGIGVVPSLVLATGAEVLCALLLMLGFFTRLSLIPLMFTMIVAAFVVNAGEPLGKIEMALLYLFAYLALFIAGPGWYSIDARWRNKW
jgi:putative oxidoreductase